VKFALCIATKVEGANENDGVTIRRVRYTVAPTAARMITIVITARVDFRIAFKKKTSTNEESIGSCKLTCLSYSKLEIA